jgi:hypothetical protein
MKKNKSLFCLLALVSFLSLAACQTTSNTATNNSSTTGDYVYSSTAVSETASSVPATSVLLNTSVKTGKTVQDTSYNCKVTLAQDSSSASDASLASVNGNVITLTNNGASEAVYYVSGTLTEGYLVVASSSTGAIRIILDGVSITDSTASTAPIWDKATSGGGLTIEVNDESVNLICDKRASESKPKGAVYTVSDSVTIAGQGTLSIENDASNGINSAGGIVINDAATINVITYGHGIKTDKEFACKGEATISVKTTYQGNAVSADGGISVTGNATFNLVTLDGSSTDTNYSVGGGAGLKTDGDINISSGTFNITTAGGAGSSHYEPDDTDTTNDPVNTKGIKAGDGDTSGTGGNINITGGTFNINSRDDALHASGFLDTSTYAWEDGTIDISGGTFTIRTGDDAVHGDKAVTIEEGSNTTYLNLAACYEGLEGKDVYYKGGTTYITSTDDAVNAASKDISELTSNYYDYELLISGGYLLCDSSGDGLDSNGNIDITGGFTVVSGPTDAGNGELDYGDGSTCKMTQSGGTLIAYGSGGQMNGFTVSASNQGAAYLGSLGASASNYVVVTDSDDQVVFAIKPLKAANSLYFSSPLLTAGTYNVYLTSSITNGSEIFGGVYMLKSASEATITYGTTTSSATVTFSSSSMWYSSGSSSTGFNPGTTPGGGNPGGGPNR